VKTGSLPTINLSVDFLHSLSLERTGNSAAEAVENGMRDSGEARESSIPGRSARSRYATEGSLIIYRFFLSNRMGEIFHAS